MKSWQRHVIGFGSSIPMALVVIALYEWLGVNPYLGAIVVLLPAVVLLVPWMSEGQMIWNLPRREDSK